MSQPSPTAGIVEAKGQLVVELTRLRRENEELRALFPAAQAIGRPIFFGDRSEKQARAQLGEHVSRSGHWEEDAQHKTVRWSAGIYHLLGCRVGACEPSFDQLCARIHESSREDVLQAILRANELASEASVICKLVGFDGVVREVDLRYEVIDGHSASARRAIGTLHDRHELRRAQEELLHIRAEYREAQRLAGVGSFFLDVRRKRYRWSRELFRILGIDDDLEPEVMRAGDHRVEIGQGAEDRVHVAIVADVIAHVLHRAFEEGRQPDRIHAQRREMVQPPGDARQVADPIAVRILERPGIDLIGHRTTPPFGHPGLHPKRARPLAVALLRQKAKAITSGRRPA